MKNNFKKNLSSIISLPAIAALKRWQAGHFSSREGFTFIELLVVIAVLMVTGSVIGVILFSTLKGAKKTNTLSVVRQNGNYVMSQMAKTIRNAKQFNGVSANGVAYLTDCNQTPGHYSSVKITDTSNRPIVYACDGTTQNISSDSALLDSELSNSPLPVPLFDTNVVVVDGQNSCYFTCSQTNFGDNPTIGINFLLRQAQASNLSDNQAAVQFSTSINIRNLAM